MRYRIAFQSQTQDADWIRAVLRSGELSKIAQHVALTVHAASRFDPDGCSIRFLVGKTGWSKTTIREAVAEITKRGVQMTSAVLCSYCGRLTHDAHEDHVAPRRHGGADEDSNIVPTCKSCNSSKSDTPLLVLLAQREVRS